MKPFVRYRTRMSSSISPTLDERQAIGRAFIDRRQDAERYRQEAARLRCDAEIWPTTIAERFIAVSRHFDDLAETIENARAHSMRR
jgi:hypothetical protein